MFLLFIIIGFLLFYLGLRFRDIDGNISLIMSITAGFFILISGLFVLGLGVDFPNGSIEYFSYDDINSSVVSNITKVYTYDNLKGGIDGSYGLSYALFFLAFTIFIVSALNFYSGRNEPKEYFEEEE